MLGYFQVDTGANIIRIMDVPVCADYCNAWFGACKDRRTGRVLKIGWRILCLMPIISQITVHQIQTAAHFKRYMETVEACAIRYGEMDGFIPLTGTINCTVMAFDNHFPNPNFKLTFPRSGSISVVKFRSTIIHGAALLILLVIAAAI